MQNVFIALRMYINYDLLVGSQVGLKDGQSLEEGQAIAHDLMQKLGVKDEDLLTCAYMDLILKEKSA